VSVKIATGGGITAWQPGGLDTTVRDFRGH
jgi:hypothetical protein